MFKGLSAQETCQVPESDAHTEQFEMLKDFILKEYYRPDHIEGWEISEMKRPGRKTVLRLIRFFLTEM